VAITDGLGDFEDATCAVLEEQARCFEAEGLDVIPDGRSGFELEVARYVVVADATAALERLHVEGRVKESLMYLV